MEKRVFLAILLSFAVLALYQAYFAPPPPAPQEAQTAATPAPAAPPAPQTQAPAPQVPAPPPAPDEPEPAAVVGDTAARDIVVETDNVVAVFTTRGGVLTSWKLKRYFEGGQPLDLVPRNVPDSFAKPFSLVVDDASISARLRSALYKSSADRLSLGAGSGVLEFEFQDAAGLHVRKAFEFRPDGLAFLVNVQVSVEIDGQPQAVAIDWGPGLGLGHSSAGARAFPARAIQEAGGSLDRLSASDLEEQSGYEGAIRFAGVEDQYFLSAALPRESATTPPSTVRVNYQPISLPVANGSGDQSRTFIAYTVRAAGPVAFFMGPKDLDALRAVDPELTGAIDFGMFRFLVVPLLQALKWINGYLGNYGWSIVALTVFINLVIFPLRHRSMVSMRKMQALQPEIKSIQERYAKYKITDPERQKMNQEMMALYKQRGVNPASGCVPMLLTMPVLFAFYSMLNASIELRGAYFFGWLQDLSVKDPYYITPILMGGTMFWQQRMMPTTADPVQQKMFLLMPIIFTTMFLAAPSGLVVYWFVSNLLAIGQQYLTNRMIGPPPRAAAPSRPVKSAGSGKKG